MFKRAYQKAAKGLDKDLFETYPSTSTFRRWLAGQIQDLSNLTDPGRDVVDLTDAIEAFTTERLELPK